MKTICSLFLLLILISNFVSANGDLNSAEFENHVCRVYSKPNHEFMAQIYGHTIENAKFQVHTETYNFDYIRNISRASEKNMVHPIISKENNTQFSLIYTLGIEVILEGQLCHKLLNAWDDSLNALNNLIAIGIFGHNPEEG